METHIGLRQEIIEGLGNGLVKLIVGLPGSGKSRFLHHDLFAALSEDAGNRVVEVDEASYESPSALLKQKKAGDSRLIVLAEDIFLFPHPESLIDSFAGREGVDLIATSSFSPSYALGKEETLIRGRYEQCYFSPLSYAESLELGLVGDKDEYLSKGGLFLSKEDCLKKAFHEGLSFRRFRKDYLARANSILDLLIPHLDEPHSLLGLSGLVAGRVSRPTLKSYLDFFEGMGLVFALERENLLKGETKSGEAVYYLGEVSFLKGKAKRGTAEKSLLLMKLFSESYRLRSGYVYGDFGEGWGAKEVAFVAEKGKNKVYLSYSSGDGAKESEAMARFLRNSYPKIVVVPFATSPWRDEEGIIHIGLERFLLSEMSEIIGG